MGTKDTKFGSGKIYIFGQKRVSVSLKLPRKASVKTLQFCADKLVCVDTKNDLSVYALETTRILASYAPPGLITALATDSTLDYALIGLQNGASGSLASTKYTYDTETGLRGDHRLRS